MKRASSATGRRGGPETTASLAISVLPFARLARLDHGPSHCEQESRSQEQHSRNAVEERGGQLRVRLAAEVGAQAQLTGWCPDKVEEAGAAHLVLAVDVLQVRGRRRRDPRPRVGQ